MTLLADARAGTFASLAEGKMVNCPCCDQTVKLYARKITHVMAHQLVYLYTHGPTDRGTLNVATDGAHEWMPHKLHLWGLIVLAKDSGDGCYHITQKGRDFVDEKIKVPKFVFTYNSEVRAESEEQVSIRDCAGEYFNLDEMMLTQP